MLMSVDRVRDGWMAEMMDAVAEEVELVVDVGDGESRNESFVVMDEEEGDDDDGDDEWVFVSWCVVVAMLASADVDLMTGGSVTFTW